MSSMTLSDNHIRVIVQTGAWFNIGWSVRDLDHACQELHYMNYAAADAWEYRRDDVTFAPVEGFETLDADYVPRVLKLIDCYLYQVSGSKDWERSIVCRPFVEGLRDHLLSILPDNAFLDGCPWFEGTCKHTTRRVVDHIRVLRDRADDFKWTI